MIIPSKAQLRSILNSKAEVENGINKILTMSLNAMMHAERKHFLSSNTTKENKGNGYRPIKIKENRTASEDI